MNACWSELSVKKVLPKFWIFLTSPNVRNNVKYDIFLRMVSPYLLCWKRFCEIKIQLMFPFLDVSIQSSLISLEFSVNCDISSKMTILCWSGFKPNSYMLGIPSCIMISGHAKMKKKLVTWAWRKVLDALKTNSLLFEDLNVGVRR